MKKIKSLFIVSVFIFSMGLLMSPKISVSPPNIGLDPDPGVTCVDVPGHWFWVSGFPMYSPGFNTCD